MPASDDSLSTDLVVNTRLTLDFEQRQRASMLEESITDDELAAAYEIIFLRDASASLLASLKEITLAFNSARLIMQDAESRALAGELVAGARAAIERAENRREIRS